MSFSFSDSPQGNAPSEGPSIEMGDTEGPYSTFIQNASHELRTPLSIIQGYAELLHRGELGSLAPEQRQAITIISNRARELRTMVERIDTLMAIEAGQAVSMDFSIGELVTEVVEERRKAAERAGLTLELHLEPELPTVQGDPYHLRYAIDSLLDNGIKFTPEGGSVKVHVGVDAEGIRLDVIDTGVGIPEDKMAHLFSGFYQVDGSTTRRYGGIGLGLTLVRAVVQEHGGRLEVESRPGEGSRFTCFLPTRPPDVHIDKPGGRAVMVRHILLVDDDRSVATVLKEGLEDLPDCEVTIAANGEEALSLFERQMFDLLITDYKMPGMDGVALATHVRERYPQTAIILITAYGDDVLREQADRVPIHRILDKPVKLGDIRNAALGALEEICPSGDGS